MTINNKISLPDFLKSCPSVSEDSNYWFIRTEGGKLHFDFKGSNRVGVAYSEISLEDLNIRLTSIEDIEKLKQKISNKYPEHKRPSLILTQLTRFKFDVKKGDFVIIPSKNTRMLSVGIVENDDIEEVEIHYKINKETIKETFKTKKVKWLKTVQRSDCNPKLYQLFYSHHTIADANDYAEFINLLIYDFYQMDGIFHLAVKVKSQKNINALELFTTLNDFIRFLDFSNKELKLEGELEDVSSRINLNSPGYIEFLSSYPFIGILGLLIVAVVGGKVEIKTLKGFELKLGTSKPLIELINNFLNDREKRKNIAMLRKKLEDLQITCPETIEKMLKSTNITKPNLLLENDEESET